MLQIRFFMDQLDSLEDWVAIKEHPFLENPSERAKLRFNVRWNDAEKKVIIECTQWKRATKSGNGFQRTASFTLSEFTGVHNQLALIHSQLGPFLPALPEEPCGLWSYFVNSSPNLDSLQLCEDIRRYLLIAFDICGEILLIDTLFEVHSLDEYFEKISELRRRSYDDAVKRAENKLKNVLSLRDGSINMLDMVEVYKLEDEAMFQWNVAVAELYNYLIQPFLDVRAPALERLMEAKRGLQEMLPDDEDQSMYADMLSEWHQIYADALDSIQELYVEYYNLTVALLAETKDRMLCDKNKFGQRSFEVVAKERFIRVSEDLSAETVQLFQNMKKHYENQSDKVKQEIASLDDCPGITEKRIAALERKAYEYQVKVFDLHLDILLEEEKMIRLKMNTIKQEIAELADEVTFYDAVENPEELEEVEDPFACHPQKVSDPRLKQLDRKIVMICRKKAAIRNKRKALIEVKNLKVQKKQCTEERFRSHHIVQMKRDENKAELKQKQDFIKEERRKTVERLKQYRMKYATPSTLKPPRHQPSNQKEVQNLRNSQSTRSLKDKSLTASTRQRQDSRDSANACISVVDELPKLQTDVVICTTAQLATESFAPLTPQSLPVPAPPPPPPPLPLPGCMPPLCPLPPLPCSTSSAKRSNNCELNENQVGSSGLAVNMKMIQDAKERLKKTAPPSDRLVSVPFVSMMQLIKQKEKLRPVKPKCETTDSTVNALRIPSPDDHIKHLQEALERICHSTQPDDDESDSEDQDFQDFGS